MAMETIRYYDDPEERKKIYYAVFGKDTGHLIYLTGSPTWIVPIERVIQDVIDSDWDGLWDETSQTFIPTPKYDKEDLICVELIDTDLGDEWTEKLTYKVNGVNLSWHEVIANSPNVGMRVKGAANARALNRKDETGIPANHGRPVSIVKSKVRKPVKANENAVILQNLFLGSATRIDETQPKEQIIQQVTNTPACRVEIVIKGTFSGTQKDRRIYLVRYDGKIIGRFFPLENDLDFECTLFDYCRGDHMYQLQFESPLEGDVIISPSMIIEEIDNFHKPRRKLGRIAI